MSNEVKRYLASELYTRNPAVVLVEDHDAKVQELERMTRELDVALRKLRKALQFYANENNYNEDGAPQYYLDGEREELEKDLGHIARHALSHPESEDE